MKKVVLFLTLILSITALFGCKSQKDFNEYISQLRYDVLFAENDLCSISCYLETRESPFVSDGIVNAKENLVILKLSPKNDELKDFGVSFTTDKTYTENFSFEPRFNCYVATVSVETMPSKNLKITLSDENGNSDITLTSKKQSSTISYDKALSFVYSQNKEKIDDLISSDDNFEINLRLISEEQDFWFVGITTSENSFCFLVDGKSGKIIAQKNINNI